MTLYLNLQTERCRVFILVTFIEIEILMFSCACVSHSLAPTAFSLHHITVVECYKRRRRPLFDNGAHDGVAQRPECRLEQCGRRQTRALVFATQEAESSEGQGQLSGGLAVEPGTSATPRCVSRAVCLSFCANLEFRLSFVFLRGYFQTV